MTEYLKKAPPTAAADVAQVRDTVAAIIADVRARGLDAVREYSRRFDGWDPPSFKVGPDEIERAEGRHRTRGPGLARLRPRPDQDVRRAPARQHDRVRGRDPARRVPRPEADPRGQRRRLRARRQVPHADVGPDEHPHRQGRRRRARRGLRAALSRARACSPRCSGRLPSPGADEIWCVGRRPGARAHGLRRRGLRAGRLHRGARQQVRRRGQAPALRRRRHRPAGRTHRDPRDRRRRRGSADRRGRPAGPGRARTRPRRRSS